MKRFFACIVAITILLSNLCYAMPLLTKEETVYVNLGNYGDISEINIYSKCETNETTEIKDYTNYSEVTNLTNKNESKKENGAIIWDVTGTKTFSYTGKVSGEYYENVPWVFDITYKLNGVEAKPDALLGEKGIVEIDIKINANERANAYYQNNYILEVTSSYDMTDYLSVESDNAMITNTGNTKTLMFIVLPGQSTELNIRLGSENFSMDGITMAAVPLTGDVLDKVANIVEEKNDIKNSLDSINKSADIILDSLNGMNNGLNGISTGVTEIKKGTQELHGISDLRDEDISNLKSILEETLPLVQNVQSDLEKLNSDYETFIDMFKDLDDEVKNLQDDVDILNEEFEDIVKIAKNLPSDVNDIKNLIDSISKLTEDLTSMLDSLDDTSTENAVKENLGDLATEAKKLARYAQSIEDENPELAMSLAVSAESIGSSATNMKTIFENISLSQVKSKSTMAKDLEDLANDLGDVSDILNKSDAKTIKKFISALSDTSNTLEEMLKIVSEYNDKILEDEEDVIKTINTFQALAGKLSEMNTLSITMIDNIQSMLNILSTSIYSGTDKTLDAIVSLDNQLLNITKQSEQFKDSKNQIKDVFDNEWDKIEDETTIFNITKDVEVISFGSEENENVESVQFIFKTPDIKQTKEIEKDLEASNEKISFWDRVKIVLDKMFGWIKNIF